MDGSKLIIPQDVVPKVFPVSPSHSSSSSNGSDAEDDCEEHQNTNFSNMMIDEPFLATLIADPLYIHGQILKEAAEKEAMENTSLPFADAVKSSNSAELVYYEKPTDQETKVGIIDASCSAILT